VYGSEAKDHFDKAVRMVILLLIVVFDPLAVMLLIAGNVSLSQKTVAKIEEVEYNIEVPREENEVYEIKGNPTDKSKRYSYQN
jgi:hypothetical protein